MKSAAISRDEWLSALGAAAAPVDQSALTVQDLAERYGLSVSSVQRRMRALVREGKAVQTRKRVVGVTGIARIAPAYKLLSAKKAA